MPDKNCFHISPKQIRSISLKINTQLYGYMKRANSFILHPIRIRGNKTYINGESSHHII
jgi:hypothetical protein